MHSCPNITTVFQPSTPGCSGGGAGKGKRACNYVSAIWIPPPTPLWVPSTELSDFCQSARSGNESECKHVPRVMKSLLMSSPPISISHRLFQFPETCLLHTRSEVHYTHLIQVHLEILSRPVESMASHLLTKYITWSKSCQSLRSLESWNRCKCTSCTWLPFRIGRVCYQVWCNPIVSMIT